MTVKVLIVDDHTIVREGLALLLGLDRDIEIVGQAADGDEGVALARQRRPDVVVMDLLMPVMDGLSAIAAIRRAVPGAQVIALTSALEQNLVVEALQAGALGYLLKDERSADLRRAVKQVHEGHLVVSPRVVQCMVGEARQAGGQEELTKRELEVLRLLAEGRFNKEIAAALQISEPTVKTHVSRILAKLRAASRTQAVLRATQSGLLRRDLTWHQR